MTSLSDNKERPMFPHTFDSTILGTFRACPQKFFRQYVEHWKARESSVHLIAGGAFASGVEAARLAFYAQGESAEDAEAAGLQALIKHYGDFECPPDSAKSLERMCGALEFYFTAYPLGADGAEPITLADGRRGVEFSFAEPLGVMHPVTGDPILYTGRSDMIAERAAGIYIYDEKTTSSLGQSWAKQWEMRSQFTGYVWAAAQQGIKTHGSVVRGVSILKTKYDTMEILTHRSEYEVERWYLQVLRDIRRAIAMWEEGYWDYSLDGACTEYGGCGFTRICKSSTPNEWLPMYFRQAVWDPLAKRELSVAEHEKSWGHVRQVPLAEGEGILAPEDAGADADSIEGFEELFKRV